MPVNISLVIDLTKWCQLSSSSYRALPVGLATRNRCSSETAAGRTVEHRGEVSPEPLCWYKILIQNPVDICNYTNNYKYNIGAEPRSAAGCVVCFICLDKEGSY